MKVKSLILAFVAGPIVAYVSSQVPWWFYDLFSAYITVENLSNITLGTFGLVWLGIAYKAFRNVGVVKKKAKREKVTVNLDREITIKNVKDTFKPSIKNAVLEFIVIGSGKNLHQVVPYSKDAVYKSGDKEYTIDNNNLLIRKPFLGKIKLTAIFTEDGEPVKIKGQGNTVTAEILSLAQRSGALGRTIKEMFSTHLDLKKIMFFVIIGVVAVVIFLVIQGGIF